MGTWNYRLVQMDILLPDDKLYQIHEVHYDEKGKITGWTKEAVIFAGGTPKEVTICLTRALLNAQDKPILKESKLPKCK